MLAGYLELEYSASGPGRPGEVRLGFNPDEPGTCLVGSFTAGFTFRPASSCTAVQPTLTQWYDITGVPGSLQGGRVLEVMVDGRPYQFTLPTVTISHVYVTDRFSTSRYDANLDTVTGELDVQVRASVSSGCHLPRGLYVIAPGVFQTRHQILAQSEVDCSGESTYNGLARTSDIYVTRDVLYEVNGESWPASAGRIRVYPPSVLDDLDVELTRVDGGFDVALSLPLQQTTPCSEITFSDVAPGSTFMPARPPRTGAYYAYETWYGDDPNEQYCPRAAQDVVRSVEFFVEDAEIVDGVVPIIINGVPLSGWTVDPDLCVINGAEVESLMSADECRAVERMFSPHIDRYPLWGAQTDPCTWWRITCGPTGLEGFALSEDKIVDLSLGLGELPNLQTLFLDEMDWTEIPAVIGEVTSLRVLLIPESRQVEMPAWIGNLTELEVLVFEEMIGDFPDEFFNLTKLQVLSLPEAQISELPSMASFPDLTHLELFGVTIDDLPDDLIDHPSLEAINLRQTDVSPETAALRLSPDVDVYFECCTAPSFWIQYIPGYDGD